jgi:uncharacterized repeat protein (TIGR01451 family)
VHAAGGTAPFTWTASGSSVFEPDGANASVRYNHTGTYSVVVHDNAGLSDTCSVVVTAPHHSHTTNPAIEIEKLVRNVTLGIPERDIVAATPTNTIEFVLRVSSTGTGTARDVVVHDTLPDRVTYIPGSTTVDDTPAPDGITGGGIPLGDMPADSEHIIRFRVTLAPASFFTYTTTILTNTGFARGSNVSEVSDMANISVEKSTSSPTPTPVVIRKISTTKTGPGETLLAAFLVSAILTLLYVSYTHTSAYKRHEVTGIARERDPLDFRS